MIAHSNNQVFYWLLRACLFGLGLLLITTAVSSQLYPDIIHSESVARPFWRQLLYDGALFFYGLLLLAPHRWFLRQPFFSGKMLCLSIGVLWAAYIFLFSVVDFGRGKKSWLIVPFTFTFVLVALLAPFTLLLKRRLRVV